MSRRRGDMTFSKFGGFWAVVGRLVNPLPASLTAASAAAAPPAPSAIANG
jgi:hypothetical protein